MKYWIACPFQSSFCVEAEDETVLTNLKLKYGRYCTPHGAEDTPCFSVTRENEESWQIRWKGEWFRCSSPLGFLSQEMVFCRRFDPRVFALHGAAVEVRGKACVFLAATTAGKTTLTAYLVQKGMGYLTDDCVLIDRETLAVYPCTTPVHLRQGGVEVLRRYGALPPLLQPLGDPGFERWTFLPERCIESPLPLEKIFFLQRTEDENGVHVLETNDAFSRLLKSPITEYPLTAEHLKTVSRLTQTRPEELRYKDMNYVVEELSNGCS